MTNEEHNKYIAWTFIANGLFQSLMLLFIFAMVFFFFAVAEPPPGDFPGGFIAMIFGFALLINLAFLSPNFIAGYALLKRKPWARLAAIIAAVMSAMNVPIGTAACVYSLWFFFGDQWKEVYPSEDANTQSDMSQIGSGREVPWSGHVMNEEGEVVYRHQDPPDWR
jgi:hypothetical protein